MVAEYFSPRTRCAHHAFVFASASLARAISSSAGISAVPSSITASFSSRNAPANAGKPRRRAPESSPQRKRASVPAETHGALHRSVTRTSLYGQRGFSARRAPPSRQTDAEAASSFSGASCTGAKYAILHGSPLSSRSTRTGVSGTINAVTEMRFPPTVLSQRA